MITKLTVVDTQGGTKQANDDSGDQIVVDGHKPLVPAGEYLARYLGHDTALLFVRAPKAILHFEICEGPYAGTRLNKYYRIERLLSKPGPNGRIKLGAGQDLYRMLVKVLDVKVRRDRISLAALRTTLLRIAVRTVKQDRHGRTLAEGAWYSVIDAVEDGR